MESPVTGLLVFMAAFLAQGESLQRGVGAFIWHRADNCVPWAAMRAAREWISMAAVVKIGDLVRALWAQSAIQGNPRSEWA
jgi:hypothetical protein